MDLNTLAPEALLDTLHFRALKSIDKLHCIDATLKLFIPFIGRMIMKRQKLGIRMHEMSSQSWLINDVAKSMWGNNFIISQS